MPADTHLYEAPAYSNLVKSLAVLIMSLLMVPARTGRLAAEGTGAGSARASRTAGRLLCCLSRQHA